MREIHVLRKDVAAGDGWGSHAPLEVLGQETPDGWQRVAVRGGERSGVGIEAGRLVYMTDMASKGGAEFVAADLPSPLSISWLDLHRWTRVGK